MSTLNNKVVTVNAFKALSSSWLNSLSKSNYFAYGTNTISNSFGSFISSPPFLNLPPPNFYPFPYVSSVFDNAPSPLYLVASEINGYRVARERVTAQALYRQYLSKIFNSDRCANYNSLTPYPYIPSYVKPQSIFRPRPSEIIIDTTYIPNIVPVVNRPRTVVNTEAVKQEDGSLKAVIEAILEARRRLGMNEYIYTF